MAVVEEVSADIYDCCARGSAAIVGRTAAERGGGLMRKPTAVAGSAGFLVVAPGWWLGWFRGG
jgi:hypothetical protein